MGQVRTRFPVESVLAAMSAIALVATIAWPQWIEAVLGAEPDGGSGALEVFLSVFLATATVAFVILARAERRRGLAAAR